MSKVYGFYRVVITDGEEENEGIYFSPDGKTFLWFDNLDTVYLRDYAAGNVGRLEDAVGEGYEVVSAEYLG